MAKKGLSESTKGLLVGTALVGAAGFFLLRKPSAAAEGSADVSKVEEPSTGAGDFLKGLLEFPGTAVDTVVKTTSDLFSKLEQAVKESAVKTAALVSAPAALTTAEKLGVGGGMTSITGKEQIVTPSGKVLVETELGKISGTPAPSVPAASSTQKTSQIPISGTIQTPFGKVEVVDVAKLGGMVPAQVSSPAAQMSSPAPTSTKKAGVSQEVAKFTVPIIKGTVSKSGSTISFKGPGGTFSEFFSASEKTQIGLSSSQIMDIFRDLGSANPAARRNAFEFLKGKIGSTLNIGEKKELETSLGIKVF